MAETATFDEFVTTRSRHLLRVAYLLTGDHALAEDLLQTTLVKSWSVWPRIEGDPEPYVRRVLANTFNSWWRRRWTGERPTDTLPEPPGTAPQSAVDERDRVWRALSRLPRQQRVVLVLRYFEDLSEADIARTLDISRGSVKTHAAKGLAKLRLDPGLSTLPLPDGDDVPAGNERLVAVRGRIASRHRRAVAAVVAVFLAIALIAVYAMLPQLRTKAIPEPAFPIELPEYAASRRGVPVDTDYYRIGASAQHDYAARVDWALVWTPNGRQEAIFVACSDGPIPSRVAIVYVNGRETGVAVCTGEPGSWQDFVGVVDPEWLQLMPGRPAVISLVMQFEDPGTPVPPGTIAVGVGELLPFDAYPLPEPRATPAPLDRSLGSPPPDPASVTWLGSGQARTATRTWEGSLVVAARAQTPGRLRVLVDGVLVSTLDFDTTGKAVLGNPISVVLQAGRKYRGGHVLSPERGVPITITVEPERITGDWFAAIYPIAGG